MMRATSWIALAAALLAAAQGRAAETASDIPDCSAAGITAPKPANVHAMGDDDYPVLSVALGEEGTTILAIVVQPDGSVSEAKASKSSGSLRLDDAAAQIVAQRWRYTPPLRDGKAIACRNHVGVDWRMHDGDDMLGAPQNLVVRMKDSDFPPGALAKGEKGATGVFVTVAANGQPNVVVARSSGFGDLDAAAAAIAFKKVKLSRGEFDGKPMETFMVFIMLWSPGSAAPK